MVKCHYDELLGLGTVIACTFVPEVCPLIRRKWSFMPRCQDHVSEALRLSAELMKLADEQRGGCEHDGCILLDGVIRDCAWKIRQASLQWRLDLGQSDDAERTG